MTNQELENKKMENQLFLEAIISKKNNLEKEKTIILYLEQIQFIQEQQKYQAFLNNLEIGKDGTVFGPHRRYTDKAFNPMHYKLSVVLDHAFRLCYWNMSNTGIAEEEQNWITFEQLQKYISNANKTLTNMNYILGDRLIKNDYQLEIYENPKNYSIAPFDNQIASLLTEEEWNNSYYVPGISLIEDFGFLCFSKDQYKELNKEHLTPREYEAFYGEHAMIALGLEPIPSNSLKKVKQPK